MLRSAAVLGDAQLFAGQLAVRFAQSACRSVIGGDGAGALRPARRLHEAVVRGRHAGSGTQRGPLRGRILARGHPRPPDAAGAFAVGQGTRRGRCRRATAG